MKITKIGFGYTKNLGNYENCKLYLEAQIEGWEDASQSLNILRNQALEELSLPDKYLDLKGKFARQIRASEDASAQLDEINKKIEQAKLRWDKYSNFLIEHGVDPISLDLKTDTELPTTNQIGCEPTGYVVGDDDDDEDDYYYSEDDDDY